MVFRGASGGLIQEWHEICVHPCQNNINLPFLVYFAVLRDNFLHSCKFPVFYILLFTLYFLYYIFRKVMLASKAPHNKWFFKDSHTNYNNKTRLTNKQTN